MPRAQVWGDEVVRVEINGHSSLAYRDRPTSILEVLAQARNWPERTFIRQGRRAVTFSEHEDLVARFADRLASYGIGRGDRVGIYSANSPEWVATFFAALRVGAIVVPCNGWWSAEEMANACAVVSPKIVIADDRRAALVPGGTHGISIAALGSDGPGARPSALAEPASQLSEDDPAVILFTAGTTAFSKGAMLSHRALVANLQTLLVVSRKLPHQLSADARPSVALVGLPLFHIGAIQLILFPLMTGSEIVFLDGRFDAGNVLSLIETDAVTMFSGVPTMVERLLSHEDISRRDISSLRTVVLGGAPVDGHLLDRIRDAFPSTNRGVGQTYGLTEAGGVVSTGVGADIRAHPGSSGRLAPVVEVRVDQPGVDGSGELLVRSPAAMDGYWGLPDDETIDADGWLHTGDIGRVDAERYLYVSGRAKDVIIRGGENVAAVRVEAVLRRHPAIMEVAVVGMPDEDLGEVVAAVVLVSDSTSERELEEFARKSLAHFAVPTRWWFRSESLPVNDSGKILKRQLVREWPNSPVAAETGQS
jgi:long-chain acyl-CoA synthetase